MDKNGPTYEDRDRGRNYRKQHREERQRHDDDALEDGQDLDSRQSKAHKRRDEERHQHRSKESSNDPENRHERSKSHERGAGIQLSGRGLRSSKTRIDNITAAQCPVVRGPIPMREGQGIQLSVAIKREVKRERRRFEDRADEDLSYLNGNHQVGKRDDRQIDDKSEEVRDMREGGKNKFIKIGGPPFLIFLYLFTLQTAVEQLAVAGGDVSITTVASSHPKPLKVSTISTTNEKDGVNITRSDEVPGKFSADKSAISVAGKSSSLSLDALAKAKKALQMQRELSEKLKKIPLLNRTPSSSSGTGAPVGLKSGEEASSLVGQGISSASTAVAQPTSSEASERPPASTTVLPVLTTMPNYEAVKRAQELAARMGFHHDPQFAPLINMFPGTAADASVQPQKPSKAPVLRLDALGREIDEHGNVINMPKPTSLSTLKVNINKQKKEAFQILKPDLDVDTESHPHFDERMGINKAKILRPKRMTFQFVEEGKWARQAEIIRFKSQFGEAQAKELKIKQTQLAKAKAEPDINPNLIEVSERVVKQSRRIPFRKSNGGTYLDRPILISGTYSDSPDEKLNLEKINIYIEHPLPIEPPAEPAPPPPQPLKLTKKEQKKLRTQRRLAKERDRQEMIRQGLIEPPKPKVKMSNLMKVLGSEATQDPTKLEMEIRSAAAEREQAHVDRNIARKLTPAERREKKERKLFEDPYTLETIVSVYKVNHLAHPKARFQVDVNAQENHMTGCAVISEGICVIVQELMLKRIDWAAAVGDEDEGSDALETPDNKCLLVWQGSVVRPSFNRFFVHQCRTETAARKVFADAGVEHYWDLAANYSEEVM
ncbi:unnamed protein product [Spirodela intermedia]|uniref:Uncharacterized protein n=1 Tax=Spirodela intermedia TaxID=51605 RepID=A0A7I8JCU4_SPIIN|nr:unnamed protein product [Spirodela intermedia]CAA6667988.1 unnamed protein product [Spirodela intermedia]